MINQNYAQQTYSEQLGFDKNAKVIILHVDDVGMSLESNQGAMDALTNGIASSCSIMMPCPWVPGFLHFLNDNHNQTIDAGLHLTLNAEWKDYRWGPLSGIKTVPGLVDIEGALWNNVADLIKNANPTEIEIEIEEQFQRCVKMGWFPTHFDTHLGALLANKDFLEKYMQLGVKHHVPIMFPAGHNTLVNTSSFIKIFSKDEVKAIGKKLWDARLVVIDDLHSASYGFKYPAENISDSLLQDMAVEQYIQSFENIKPGITMVIMHCCKPSENFKYITDSKTLRRADYLAMLSPKLKSYLEKNSFIITSWRDLQKKRDSLKN